MKQLRDHETNQSYQNRRKLEENDEKMRTKQKLFKNNKGFIIKI